MRCSAVGDVTCMREIHFISRVAPPKKKSQQGFHSVHDHFQQWYWTCCIRSTRRARYSLQNQWYDTTCWNPKYIGWNNLGCLSRGGSLRVGPVGVSTSSWLMMLVSTRPTRLCRRHYMPRNRTSCRVFRAAVVGAWPTGPLFLLSKEKE